MRRGRLSAECITGCVYKQRTHDRYTVCGMVTTNMRANPRFQRVEVETGGRSKSDWTVQEKQCIQVSLYACFRLAIIFNLDCYDT